MTDRQPPQPWPRIAASIDRYAKDARECLGLITGMLTGGGGTRLRSRADLESVERRLLRAQREIADALIVTSAILAPGYDIDAYERRMGR